MRPIKSIEEAAIEIGALLRHLFTKRFAVILGIEEQNAAVFADAWLRSDFVEGKIPVDDVIEKDGKFVADSVEILSFREFFKYLQEWQGKRGTEDLRKRLETVLETYFKTSVKDDIDHLLKEGSFEWERFDLIKIDGKNKLIPIPRLKWFETSGTAIPNMGHCLPLSRRVKQYYPSMVFNFYTILPTVCDSCFDGDVEKFFTELQKLVSQIVTPKGNRVSPGAYAVAVSKHLENMPIGAEDRENLMGVAGMLAPVLETMNECPDYPKDIPQIVAKVLPLIGKKLKNGTDIRRARNWEIPF